MPRPRSRQYRGASNKGAPRRARQKTSIIHGVVAPEGIALTFREHGGEGQEHVYIYTFESAGEAAVQEMISLLRSGAGLNRYINETKPGWDIYADPRKFQTDTAETLIDVMVYKGQA